MSKQALLERIEKRIKVTKGPKPLVTLTLPDWEAVQDMVLELASPQLLKGIEQARKDYKKHKGEEYKPKFK